MQNKIIKICIFFVFLAVFFGCELPDDKIIPYTPMKGSITGLSVPKNIKIQNNYMFVQDNKGLYMVNLQMLDYEGDVLSDKDFIYENSSLTYGDIMNFDVSGDCVYIATVKSSVFYILKYIIYLDEYIPFCVPNGRSVNYISISDDCLILSGNANVALKGIDTGDSSDDSFDTTSDYVAQENDDSKNMCVSPAKPIGIRTSKGYDIYLLSMSSDQSGIRKYTYQPDVSADHILLEKNHHLTLYPLDLTLMSGTKDKLISSEQGQVVIYKLSESEPFFEATSTIDIGKENGALRTLEYKDNLATLYGYKVTANKYDKTTYDIYAYWCGVKIIENPESGNPKIKKEITIDGWATDFDIYGDYLFVANQVKNCINIYNLQ